MQYYKKLELEDAGELITSCHAYLTTLSHVVNKELSATFYPLDVEELTKQCPLINQIFGQYGLTCNFAAAYVMNKTTDSPIHIDSFPHDCRINIPILNCEKSYTVFYTGGNWLKIRNRKTETNAWHSTTRNFVEQDRVEIDRPTIMRVTVPHTVIMETDKKPRITLTLGFDIDPAFLLD